MPRSKPVSPRQLDMLDLMNFEPQAPVVSFKADDVRAATIGKSISKAISAVLRACGRDREKVAAEMREFLDDDKVSKNMLDAYASEARSEHVISVVRFIGLIAVTKDRRLLEFIAAQFGWAVVDRKYLSLIEIAQLTEIRDEMNSRIEVNRRKMRREGTL